jgi:hypothetical protein
MQDFGYLLDSPENVWLLTACECFAMSEAELGWILKYFNVRS